MLSCKPAQAASRSDFEPFGSRVSSPPTRRRNARICFRVSLSREFTGLAASLHVWAQTDWYVR
jgi:hypothetical protein